MNKPILRGETVSRTIAAGLGICTALVLLACGEWAVRLSHKYSSGPHNPASDGFIIEERRTIMAHDPDLGFRLKPNERTEAVARNSVNKELFRVTYTTDPYGRRNTPGQTEGDRPNPLLFLGCSFIFGVGLNDDQTLPSRVIRYAPGFRAYNYGVNGFGPGNVLRMLQTPGFASDIPRSDHGKAIYLFIDHHIKRLIGSLGLARQMPNWTTMLPQYELTDEGQLESHGMLSERWSESIYRAGAKSQLLELFNLDFPLTSGDSHYALLAKVVLEMKLALQRNSGISDFTFVFYPGSKLSRAITPHLRQLGIRTLEYPPSLWNGTVPIPALPDGHPTAEANEYLAQQLAKDLLLR